MKNIEYTYQDNKNLHVIQAKVSANSKIGTGYVVQTYHFSLDQVRTNNITLDGSNCLTCKLSFTNNDGLSGGCYTHEKLQFMGLKSMLRRLHNNLNNFKAYDKNTFDTFIETVKNYYPVDLVRFGAYGEPVLLGEYNSTKLATLSKKTTGYSHQWKLKKFAWSAAFFMSSTHSIKEAKTATNKGFRNFVVIDQDQSIKNATNCPASKESNNKLSCIKCGLCNGSKTGIKKDVFIFNHSSKVKVLNK